MTLQAARAREVVPTGTVELGAETMIASAVSLVKLLIPSFGASCCRSPRRSHFAVVPGVAYTFSVGFDGTAGDKPKGTVPFELTTSLGPCQMMYWNWHC